MVITKISSSKKSTVASGRNFDISLPAFVRNTFPIDFISDSRQGELTLEMSARSNLQLMLMSLVIMASNHLPTDRMDVTLPVLKLLSREVTVIEVFLTRASELAAVSIKSVVILVEHKLLIIMEIFDCLVGTSIKLLKILAILFIGQIDSTENVIIDSGNSRIESIEG